MFWRNISKKVIGLLLFSRRDSTFTEGFCDQSQHVLVIVGEAKEKRAGAAASLQTN